MKKFVVSVVNDSINHTSIVVYANDKKDIVDCMGKPTPKFIEFFNKKTDFNSFKIVNPYIKVDVICIENDELPSPYIF